MGTEISLAVVAPNPFRGSLECPEAFKKFRRDVAVKTEQVSSRSVFFFMTEIAGGVLAIRRLYTAMTAS